MSRQAEEAHSKWWKERDEECQRNLVIGARIYRRKHEQIEEGEVRRIDRVRYSSDGYPIVDPKGPYALYVACFGNDWESQTYQWKFFYKIEDAKKDLVKYLCKRADEARREAKRLDMLAASFEENASDKMDKENDGLGSD